MGEIPTHRTNLSRASTVSRSRRATVLVATVCLGACLLAACTDDTETTGARVSEDPSGAPAADVTAPAVAGGEGATTGPAASGAGTSPAALADTTGVSRWVAVATIHARTGPASSRKVVARLHRGAVVTVVGTSGGWSEIRHGSGTAWVVTRHLTATKPQRVVDRIAHHYGIATVEYVKTSVCGTFTKTATQSGLLGCYELAHPGRIEVAAWMKSYTTLSPSSFGKSRAGTTARHETAHALIRRVCGTAVPPAAKNRIENVTDAYAHLYVGARAAYYGYTTADLGTARALHAGHCG